MTATVTVRARAVPVTVTIGETSQTVDPWLSQDFHIDGTSTIQVTEAEPAADPEPEQADEASDAAAIREAEADEAFKSKRSRRAPAADSDSTQVAD